jgi:hypothetical protein
LLVSVFFFPFVVVAMLPPLFFFFPSLDNVPKESVLTVPTVYELRMLRRTRVDVRGLVLDRVAEETEDAEETEEGTRSLGVTLTGVAEMTEASGDCNTVEDNDDGEEEEEEEEDEDEEATAISLREERGRLAGGSGESITTVMSSVMEEEEEDEEVVVVVGTEGFEIAEMCRFRLVTGLDLTRLLPLAVDCWEEDSSERKLRVSGENNNAALLCGLEIRCLPGEEWEEEEAEAVEEDSCFCLLGELSKLRRVTGPFRSVVVVVVVVVVVAVVAGLVVLFLLLAAELFLFAVEERVASLLSRTEDDEGTGVGVGAGAVGFGCLANATTRSLVERITTEETLNSLTLEEREREEACCCCCCCLLFSLSVLREDCEAGELR